MKADPRSNRRCDYSVKAAAGIHLLLCATLLSLASCDRGKAKREADARYAAAVAERLQAEATTREAADKAFAERRKTYDKFIEDCQPTVKQFRAINARCQSGITFPEYRQKVGELSDAIAGINSVPNKACWRFLSTFRQALSSYQQAEAPFEDEIKLGIEADAYSDRSNMASYVQSIRGAISEKAEKRQKLWSDANDQFTGAEFFLKCLSDDEFLKQAKDE